MDEVHAWYEPYFIVGFYFRDIVYFIPRFYLTAFKIK